MATTAISGPGFLLQLGANHTVDPDDDVYATTAGVRDIKGPSRNLDMVEITNQSSPDGYDEWAPGLKRGGEVTFPCIWDPDDATLDDSTGIQAELENRTIANYRILYPDPSTKGVRFKAYCTKFDPTSPYSGPMTADVTFKVIGKPVMITKP